MGDYSNHLHDTYRTILQERGKRTLEPPLWKLRVSDDEYTELQLVLQEAERAGNLPVYGPEAAICYAEWWRRNYHGGFPSKESVASDLGIFDSEELYKAARKALADRHFPFIKTTRTEYFRTLLCQGGIPMRHITSGNNLSSYKNFLKGLVRELTILNVDWNETDASFVSSLGCVAHLPSSFQNDSIYDISLQVAHAIIEGNNDLLPYDADERALGDLTSSLRNEYKRAKSQRHVKPFSISWKLDCGDGQHFSLLYSFDVVKEISSKSLPGIDISNCYSFDVIINNRVVAKYVRLRYEEDPDTGELSTAIYSRINLAVSNSFIWNGEPVIEVKLRCDDDKRLFLSIPGSNAPDFSYPQVFQLLGGSLYAKTQTANAEDNIVVFTGDWESDERFPVTIGEQDLFAARFDKDITLARFDSGELITLHNNFTPYAVEFTDNYLEWLESSNYRLCTKAPLIRVYDGERNNVQNFSVKWKPYRAGEWRNLKRGASLPVGLLDIKVIYPDDNYETFRFYNIGDLSFSSLEESAYRTKLAIQHAEWTSIRPVANEAFSCFIMDSYTWAFERSKELGAKALTCTFEFARPGEPLLSIEVPLPFFGTYIKDPQGNEVQSGTILSYSELQFYKIVSYGARDYILISYVNGNDLAVKYNSFSSRVMEGIIPLSDYIDSIDRMFNLYGDERSNRKSAVTLKIGNKVFFVRQFVMDVAYSEDGRIVVTEKVKESEDKSNEYEGDLLICPIGNDRKEESYSAYRLKKEVDGTFSIPDDFPSDHGLVFSGRDVVRRVAPKRLPYFPGENYNELREMLQKESFDSVSWKLLCTSFSIATRHNIPYSYFQEIEACASEEQLVAKFVAAMFYNGHRELLVQGVGDFEKEFTLALHWVKPEVWNNTVGLIIDKLVMLGPELMTEVLGQFIGFLADLYSVTLGPETSPIFAKMISSGSVTPEPVFDRASIQLYRSRAIGATDNNADLPVSDFNLGKGKSAYMPDVDMTFSQKTMILGPIFVAENIMGVSVESIWDYSPESMSRRRTINFYREYFKNTYSNILLRGMGILANKKR